MEQIFGTLHHVDAGQECMRALVIFIYGLILVRLSGRRTFAKWSALDIIISIVVGSSLSRVITGTAPFAGTLAAAALLAVLHVGLAYLVARSEFLSAVVEGKAVTLFERGKLDEGQRLRHLISRADLAEALHQKSVEDVAQTSKVMLEPNGKLNVIKASA